MSKPAPKTTRPAPAGGNTRQGSYIIPTVLLALAISLGTMRLSYLLPASVLPILGLANSVGNLDPLVPITISAQGINATFLPFGARLTSLFVDDKDGIARDVVVGYDDPSFYVKQARTSNAYVGGIVGRYANRIKNGTFEVDGNEYHVNENEHDGKNTLHGGFVGYDERNWTVTAHNVSSITFSYLDPAGTEGFPGTVLNHVTYTLTPSSGTSRGKLTSRITSLALDAPTPIMLSTHIYWNLAAFLSPTILQNTLQLPTADRIIAVDSLNIPTGQITPIGQTSLDFRSPKPLADGVLHNSCGPGCTGIDNAFLFTETANSSCDVNAKDQVRLIWSAPETGLTMKMRTNQQGIQIFSCATQDGSTVSHLGQGTVPGQAPAIEKYGCLVIEPQGWIDGINQPQWGQEALQVFSGEGGVNVNWAEYDFTV